MIESQPVDQTNSPALTIFDLLTAYHKSLESMKAWLIEAPMSELERIAIADAWQAEMRAWFRANGYCFSCNRPIERCSCEEALEN